MIRRSVLQNAIRLATVLLALTAASFAGVTVSSPTNGATTNSPLHVVATATPNNPSAPIAALQIYVDGGLVYQGKGANVDTYLNVGAGNHQVAVQSWDAAGTSSVQSVNVVGTGVGIFLSSPGANTTLNGSAHLVAAAVSQNPITVMQVYDNGNLMNQVSGGSLDTSVNLVPGSNYLVVQAWDSTGAVFFNPVTVNVPGAEAPPMPQSPPATTKSASAAATGAPQANIPSGAAAKTDIDQMGGWESCDACAGLNGSGPVDPYSMTQNIQSPSLDGSAATYWLGGKVPWGAALWWKQLGPNDGVSHFVYDLQFYVSNPQVAQGLEFDVNQSVNGLKYIFGTECDVRTGGGWRIWDTANAHWTQTAATCQVNANSWNHLTWEVERIGNQTHFIAVTLNGFRQVVDKYYYARPVGNAREINVAFQMDGDEHEDNYQAWLDKVTLYYW
jgi:hypothetical protein